MSHVLELDKFTPEDYERSKLLGACLTQQAAESNRALQIWQLLRWSIFSISSVALSAEQGPTPISVDIYYGQLGRTAVAYFDS